jgi:hypothetical protein
MANSTWLEDVLDYIITKSIGTKGTDLYDGFTPEVSTSPITVLTNTGGPPRPNSSIPRMVVTCQAMTRASTLDAAEYRAAQIHNVLDGIYYTTAGNIFIESSSANGMPADIGIDEQKRFRVVANYAFQIYIPVSSSESTTGYGGDVAPSIHAG